VLPAYHPLQYFPNYHDPKALAASKYRCILVDNLAMSTPELHRRTSRLPATMIRFPTFQDTPQKPLTAKDSLRQILNKFPTSTQPEKQRSSRDGDLSTTSSSNSSTRSSTSSLASSKEALLTNAQTKKRSA